MQRSASGKLARRALLVLAATAAMIASASSTAAADASGYPHADATDCSQQFGQYSWCKNGSWLSSAGYGYRNCTDFAAWKVASLGVPPAKYAGLGNANTWDDNAASKGLAYNSAPAVGSVAVSNAGTFGHVAFVEAVNGPSITISEYNYYGNGTGDTRTVAASSFSGFVHFEAYATSGGGGNGAATDIYAVVRNDPGSNHTAMHVTNGGNWGQYLQNAATGLPVTNGSWSFDVGDLNRDGVPDLWAFNRNEGGGHTVVHVLNGANPTQWLQAGDIALPGTDAGWLFKVADFNHDGVVDIFGINRANGWPHTAVHVINGANWGQYLQAGDIGLPGVNADWDFDVADFNRDGTPDIFGFNRAPGYPHTIVHVINGANWGQWLQAGDIGLPDTNANWSFAVGDQNGDGIPDIFGINRAPGFGHTVVHVINGANWGQWLQAGDIALPATDANWDFAVADYH
jgi:surface antigen